MRRESGYHGVIIADDHSLKRAPAGVDRDHSEHLNSPVASWTSLAHQSGSQFDQFSHLILGFGQVNGSDRKRGSRHKHGSAVEAAGAQIGEGLVGVLEWIGSGVRDYAHPGSLAQEIDAILSRKIGDRQELTLFPE